MQNEGRGMKNDEEWWRLNDEGWWFKAVEGFCRQTNILTDEWTLHIELRMGVMLPILWSPIIFNQKLSECVCIP